MLQGVIFDMDGLLLDSERDAVDAWVEIARRHGYEMPAALVASTCGCDYRDTKQIIINAMPEGFAYDALREERNRLMADWHAERGIPLRPTVRPFLEALQAHGIPFAVGTSTDRERAMERLRLGGIDGFFTVLACGSEVPRGKPDPAIFLLAASRLGLAPESCAVFEDSYFGLLAARACGMTGFCIPDLLTLEERPELAETADYVAPTLMDALPTLFTLFERDLSTILA